MKEEAAINQCRAPKCADSCQSQFRKKVIIRKSIAICVTSYLKIDRPIMLILRYDIWKATRYITGY
jgi:hypothetical protein